MKVAVDEIRATGQYVFWRDEDRKKGYASNYHKKRSKKREKQDVIPYITQTDTELRYASATIPN